MIVDAALPSRWTRVKACRACEPRHHRNYPAGRDSAPPEALLQPGGTPLHEIAYVRLNSSIDVVHDDDYYP